MVKIADSAVRATFDMSVQRCHFARSSKSDGIREGDADRGDYAISLHGGVGHRGIHGSFGNRNLHRDGSRRLSHSSQCKCKYYSSHNPVVLMLQQETLIS